MEAALLRRGDGVGAAPVRCGAEVREDGGGGDPVAREDCGRGDPAACGGDGQWAAAADCGWERVRVRRLGLAE
jgi:hypothetical protein